MFLICSTNPYQVYKTKEEGGYEPCVGKDDFECSELNCKIAPGYVSMVDIDDANFFKRGNIAQS